jgi:hypothetical protein
MDSRAIAVFVFRPRMNLAPAIFDAINIIIIDGAPGRGEMA